MECLFFILVIYCLFYSAPRKKKPSNPDALPYLPAGPLFTPAEGSFLGVLNQAVSGKARVFGKVRVGDVLKPKPSLQRGPATTARNRINRKHFDFILCRPDDLSVICVIELDDKSHQSKARQ